MLDTAAASRAAAPEVKHAFFSPNPATYPLGVKENLMAGGTSSGIGEWFIAHEHGVTLLIAIIGAATGILATVLSILSFVLEHFRRKRDETPYIDVTPKIAWFSDNALLITSPNAEQFSWWYFVAVEITNQSKFPVYIASIGVTATASSQVVLKPAQWESSHQLPDPICLQPGQPLFLYSRRLSITEMVQHGANGARVTLTSGASFDGSSPIFGEIKRMYDSMEKNSTGIVTEYAIAMAKKNSRLATAQTSSSSEP